jgi:hypothetical protein
LRQRRPRIRPPPRVPGSGSVRDPACRGRTRSSTRRSRKRSRSAR